jgi:hypothetical protein
MKSSFTVTLAALLGALIAGCATTKAPATPPAAASRPLPDGAKEIGRDAIARMSGCYIVDYSYHETKALKPGYTVDARVYDPNRTLTVMEWIFPLDQGKDHVRLQHVLFFVDEKGEVNQDSMIRHQAEDWERDPEWVWNYQGDHTWKKRTLQQRSTGQWVRRITNLDDGLRYQCVAPWRAVGTRAEWECGDNFSPIPGRETRDMKRSDYQALMRRSRLVVYPTSWVERQSNVKTIVRATAREPLAEEVGRNWYVRVADSQCAVAAGWARQHLPFWTLLQETWASYFARYDAWRERPPVKGTPPRWAKILEVEERHGARVATDPAARAKAEREVRAIIEADRVSDDTHGPTAATPTIR